MFHNVLARQGFSFCNRARLNFQAFAKEGCRVDQKISYRFSICQLNSACTRRRFAFNVLDL